MPTANTVILCSNTTQQQQQQQQRSTTQTMFIQVRWLDPPHPLSRSNLPSPQCLHERAATHSGQKK